MSAVNEDIYAEFGPVIYPTPAVPLNQGLGKIQEQMLLQGKTTKEILEFISTNFPAAKTSSACVAWYKAKLRREGKLPKFLR
jgi:hypothetical protein